MRGTRLEFPFQRASSDVEPENLLVIVATVWHTVLQKLGREEFFLFFLPERKIAARKDDSRHLSHLSRKVCC